MRKIENLIPSESVRKKCDCWWCRTARGENKPTPEYIAHQRAR